MTLARIPAPSHFEQKRAEFCLEWLKRAGAQNAYIDSAINVIYPVGNTDGYVNVICAHSDVVFSDTEELPLREENGKLFCPGIGDNSANVTALLIAARYIAQNELTPAEGGLLIVINSAEEGLGNLKGTRKLVEDYAGRIREFISFDSSDNAVITKAVGSKRYRVEIKTEGGHSYNGFGNRNAIYYLSSLIHTLYDMRVPDVGKTSFNVGVIKGGTSVNTIAQQAEMLYEFRSDEPNALTIMQTHFQEAISYYRTKGIEVNFELIGDRPCSGDVDEERMKALTERAVTAVKNHFGKEPQLAPGSTDCNIPLSLGIPAVCLGCYSGKGAHTREEYVQTDSLFKGLKVALEVTLGYFN
ncbi:MAG: M20/M25/M40 family metallo-hydrolase [Clostridiales bacterium]|nr:M20/M25/M40 family metallo-hydrolase [Clostridiales bacterium]